MIDIKRYQELKAAVDKAQRDHDRAEGALAQLMARLKADYGCDSIAEAEKELEVRRRKVVKDEKAYAEALAEFEREWRNKDE